MIPRARPNPLRASTYLVRNAGKTLPLVGVIVLAVMLIAGIVAIMNSIPLSIRTIYSYSQHYMGVTPRGDASRTAILRDEIQAESPVPVERVLTARASEAEVRSIVGPFTYIVLALDQDDMRYYLSRVAPGEVEGRLPEAGAPEAIISQPVATNLGLKVGDELLGPTQANAYSPQSVRVVGIVDTPMWIMLCPIEYHKVHHFPPIDVLLVFAPDITQQYQLNAWAIEHFKGERVRLFTFQELEKETDDMFAILYQILNVVIAILVVVITIMMGMLINIYQGQRLQEFGLLQALGYTRGAIVRRLLGETTLVVLLGWALGVLMGYLMLLTVRTQLMDPRAFMLNPLDPRAFQYTIPVPIVIFLTAILTVVYRFRRFDPVGVVERRLV